MWCSVCVVHVSVLLQIIPSVKRGNKNYLPFHSSNSPLSTTYRHRVQERSLGILAQVILGHTMELAHVVPLQAGNKQSSVGHQLEPRIVFGNHVVVVVQPVNLRMWLRVGFARKNHRVADLLQQNGVPQSDAWRYRSRCRSQSEVIQELHCRHSPMMDVNGGGKDFRR